MSDLARAIVIAALVLGGAVVVRGTFGTDRYDLVPAVSGSVYRLDRLTGGVSICMPVACQRLPEFVPRAAGTAPPGTPQVPGPPAPRATPDSAGPST